MFTKNIRCCQTFLGTSQYLLLCLAHQGHPVGNLGKFQIMGSLGGPEISKFRGSWSTAKRYDGHIGLDTNSGACSGPSQTCTLFALTLSVRIFGHFPPFSIFLARRAPCSAPTCTLVAWSNGPYMVFCFCTLVPMTHIPHGWTDAYTHRELAHGEYGQFCHSGTCGSSSGQRDGMANRDLREPSTCGRHGT